MKFGSIFKSNKKDAKYRNLLAEGCGHEALEAALGQEDTARFEGIFRTYLEAINTAERNRKLGEGMFGFGGGPANDPCHVEFIKQLEAFLEEFRKKTTDSAAVKTVLSEIYSAADRNPDPQSAYWTLIAVHGITEDLVGSLSKEDAASLLAAYEDSFPKNRRLPAQNKIVSLLKEAAG